VCHWREREAPAENAGCAASDLGCTPEETYAAVPLQTTYLKAARAAIQRHLTFMSSRPAASCFRDAYAADRAIAKEWLTILPPAGPWLYGQDTPEGRADERVVDAAMARTNGFLRNFAAFFADCR
jgi:hypothetical protein